MIKNGSGFQTKRVLIISGGHFLHDVFSGLLAPFLPLLITKFGLSMLLAGSFTFFFRLPSLFNPLFGLISDRIDMRHIAIWSPAITGVTMSLLGVAPCYSFVCILLLVAGISASIFHVLGPVMIAQASGKGLGKGMSLWATGGELARSVGPLAAVWAVSIWKFEKIYPIMIIGILTSIFLYIHLNNKAYRLPQPLEKKAFRETWKALRQVMLPLTGIIISRSFMTATFMAFLPTYMVDSGKSLWVGGASLAVLECSGTVGTLLGGTLSDRMKRHNLLLAIMPASSLLIFAFLNAPDWILFPILIFLGLSMFAISPINLAIVQDHSENHRGTANGLFMGISFMATATITVFVGWLADMFGLRMALMLSAFIGLAGVPIVFFLPKPPKTII